MNQAIFVKVSDLPESIRMALQEVSYGRKDIEVNIVTEPQRVESSSFQDGCRGFCALVKIDGSIPAAIRYGSWGGSNPFEATMVDDSKDVVDLSLEQLCLIKGQYGGGRPVSARIYINANNIASFTLPEKNELSEEEKVILGAMRSLKPAYRKPYIESARANGSLAKCIAKGLIKENGVGLSLTTEGKTEAQSCRGYCY